LDKPPTTHTNFFSLSIFPIPPHSHTTATAPCDGHTGWTFNFVFAHVLWWVVAFPNLLDYGYTDAEQDADGSIASGPSGSGVVIISGMLVAVSTWTYLQKIMGYTPK